MENEKFWKWKKYIFEKSDSKKNLFFWKLQVSKSSKTKFCGKTLNILASRLFWKCMSASRTNKVSTLKKLTFKGSFSDKQQYGASIRRHLCSRWLILGNYWSKFSENLYFCFYEPVEQEKSKIIEFGSIIRKLELIEVWSLSHKTRILLKKTDFLK